MLRTSVVLFFIAIACTVSAQPPKPVAEFVRLYPRPATTFLAIQLQKPHAQKLDIVVRSLIGNVITVEKEYTSDYEARLDVKNLPTGYYFISIWYKEIGRPVTYRFLKR